MRIQLPKKRLLLSAALLIGLHASAADLYMLPQGAGEKNGQNWENALSYAAAENSLEQAWQQLQPGDTLFLGGGEYEARGMQLSASASAANPITLKGVNRNGKRPVFTGDWEKEDKASGFTLIQLASESKGWVFENFEVHKVRSVFETRTPGRVSEGKIVDVDVQETRDAFVFRGGAMAAKPEIGSHDIVIRDCDVKYYTKRGFRFRDGCYDIQVINCTADAGGKEWYVEAFPMSFNVIGGAKGTNVYDHDITFIDCVASNNWHINGDSYWNGDGFCAEGTAYNLTYIRCEAYGNTDGGWDDKSANPLLIGCIAKDNKKNYRFWSGTPGALLWNSVSGDPVKRGGNSDYVGLWTKGKIRIHNSSFVDSSKPLALNDWKVTPEQMANMNISVKNSLVELPEGKTLPAPNYTVSDTVIRPLNGEGLTADGVGYQKDMRDAQVLLAEVRPYQPRIEKEGRLLETKPLNVFSEKNPSGWYLSDWNNAKMKLAKGKGINGSNALEVSTNGSKGGGATYRTKRDSATIKFANFQKANWALKMSIRTGNANLTGLELRALTMAEAPKTKEIPLPGTLNGSNTDWQEISIPLTELKVSEEEFANFAGFYIRANGSMAGPLYIDNVRLEAIH